MQPPDRVPARAAWADRKYADGSRSPGTRAGMATESPKPIRPRRARRRGALRLHEKGNPRDAHRPGCSCRRQSPPASLVSEVSQPIPAGIRELRLQSAAPEAGFAQAEGGPASLLGANNLSQSLFNQGTQGRALARGQLARLEQQRI